VEDQGYSQELLRGGDVLAAVAVRAVTVHRVPASAG
jgi:hypothetical protein